ncbi:hypothetical protein [Sinomicrobium weinanense]|uniref:Uncharacterized protein n=1 Tax=Sinomicrobium weinanense TaxID=2842200 RepID=A0A926JPY2_9FLAO|nr:hypothetical protein [Sinomicrobium weinanense]MBC9795096.1 hypothetical protein [Sinomicrobium weinanense]MBU3123773.1 hypothetical protein [Sinomicrobium weinanense]
MKARRKQIQPQKKLSFIKTRIASLSNAEQIKGGDEPDQNTNRTMFPTIGN